MTWAVDWGAPGGTSAAGLALDRAGNSYVAGSQTEDVDGRSDGYLSKRLPDGSEAWTVHWGDPAFPDVVTGVAVGEDALYVTGTTRTNLTGDDPDGGAFLMSFTLDGERVWTTQWRTGARTDGVDVAQAVMVGPGGRVYVAGGVRQEIPFGGNDVYAGIFDATTGEELWRLVLQGWGIPGSSVMVGGATYQTRDTTEAAGIAVDAAGNIYLAGEGTITAPPEQLNPQGAFMIRIE
jgi:outer membrane protein assembly factor BamB